MQTFKELMDLAISKGYTEAELTRLMNIKHHIYGGLLNDTGALFAVCKEKGLI